MRTYAMLLLLAVQPASAENELYLDIGLGRMWGLAQFERPTAPNTAPSIEEIPSPHAAVEIGYSMGNATIFAMHTSSVTSGDDRGLEVVGVKYRFSVKVP